MPDFRNLLGPMRLPFLILTPACVLLGIAAAAWTSGGVNLAHAALAMLGGVGAHVSVNALNEYFDFRSGLDFRTQRTPFSGGSGTLPENPEASRMALLTALIALAITAAVGVYFVLVQGLALLPLGILGLLIIVAYTTWISHQPLLCLLAPGIGFGLLMVMGTSLVLAGEHTWTAFIASLVPTFLVSDLLLLNQFPDAEADQTVGRRHVLIVYGKRVGSLVYAAFLIGAYLTIIIGVVLKVLPLASLLGLGSLIFAIPAIRGALQHADNIEALIPALGQNVLVNILTPVLVAVGLFIG
jgi:1,4-dihydroxy-2-naphthoate octaprenyltransferase